MFGKKESRRHKAERITGQAFDHLSSVFDNAESTARSSARTVRQRAESAYGDASSRVGTGTKEARVRANNAYDALMGRKRRRTGWQWLAAATVFGAAAGWVATRVARKAAARDESLALPDSLSDEFVQTRN
jgi:hypothetical protein